MLTTYSNHNYDGYREHNSEHWNIINTVVETTHAKNSSLKILFYFADGIIKLPGSLTKEEFDKDPYQADQRAIDRDLKRLSTKGRLGIRFNTKFGKKLNNDFELTSYATIKYFERTSRQYRIINRYGLGLRLRYGNKSKIFNRTNEFSIGSDLLYQPARTEYYDNINGDKGDQILQLNNENINNTGFYISDNYEIIHDRLYVLASLRYDLINFNLTEETLPSRSDEKTFNALSPKLAFNYKLSKWMAIYTSYSVSYDSPAKNELESLDPTFLYNPDLEAQQTRSFELGIKGNLLNNENKVLNHILFEATLFNLNIDNDIVPYEVYNEVFFRNAAKTNRKGIEIGTSLEFFKSLSFTLAYTFSDFTYLDYKTNSIEVDSSGNIVDIVKDFSGNIMPSVPKNNLYLSLSYSHKLANRINGFAKLSYLGISGLWVDDANSDKTDSYSLLNSVIGVDMKFGNLNILVSGGANNMLDVVYVGFTNTNSADRRYYEAGAPRNYFCSVNLGYRF